MRSGSVSATTFRKFISSLPFGGFQLMTFTYPHAWLSICLRWMSNGTVFLKRLSFSQMYNFLSLFCLKHFNWNMATFPNKCVFNSSRLHKPIAIIQIESLIFHVFCISVEYESFGIWTQVCNVGNTPSWIFNMLWICVCGNFLGGYFLPNFCWWGRAMLLWWWMAQRMKGNHFFSLAEYFSEY